MDFAAEAIWIMEYKSNEPYFKRTCQAHTLEFAICRSDRSSRVWMCVRVHVQRKIQLKLRILYEKCARPLSNSCMNYSFKLDFCAKFHQYFSISRFRCALSPRLRLRICVLLINSIVCFVLKTLVVDTFVTSFMYKYFIVCLLETVCP